ncbi:DMT family transporter [Salinarimonas soli]|uniref:DMT family transporter n=1 Tax=Salinarimonas soli TaxID=1638099 RepID=A0A5B2VG02_9HYPH|nr:DMT family transporter [Salinarimonas soli]KAA2237292.1 DMT family transporter [Salinarimonas soli]
MTRNLPALIGWMAGTLVSFSALAVSIRELQGRFSVFEMLSLRNAAGLAILLGLALARPDLRATLRPRRVPLQVFRNVVHFGGTYAWAVGVTVLPLALVFALEFTTPIWVAGLAVLVLGERLTGPRIAAIALGFLGVIVILRPGASGLQIGALLVLFAAMAFGVTTISTKALTRTESTFAILVWMNALQLPMNLAGADPLFWTRIPDAPLLPVLGICVLGLSAHWCLTNAYRYGDAILVVPLDFLRVPLIAIVGFALYAERLDPFLFAGAGLIIAGILWNLRAEARA